MFNLEKAIAGWRHQLSNSVVLSRPVLDELENHLREHIEAQTRQGIDPEAAFTIAAGQIGNPHLLKGEFSKLASLKYRRLAKVFRPSCFAAALFLLVDGLSMLWDSKLPLAAKALSLAALLAATFYLGALPFTYRLLPSERNPRVALLLKSMSAFFALWPIFALLDGAGIISSHLPNSLGMVGWDLYVLCVFTGFAWFLRSLNAPDGYASLTAASAHDLTDAASAALDVAREESIRLHHGYIGTEHILLGVLASESSLLADVFRKTFVTPEMVGGEVEKMVQPQTAAPPDANFRYTPRSNKALDFAAREARAMNQPYISVEHLFLGLLLEKAGIAGLVLRKLGVDYETARAEIVKGFDPGDDDGLAPMPHPRSV